MNLLKTQLKGGDRVLAGKEAVAELYKTGYFGRPKDDGLELSLVEAAYLQSRGKLDIELEGKLLGFRAFFEQASLRQQNFELKYIVYKDLKERGYYVQPHPRISGCTLEAATREKAQQKFLFTSFPKGSPPFL